MDENTYIISEYQHWEETHCYLLIGSDRALLIDTGLGVCNIYEQVRKLTDKPIAAVATHIHWDHIGGHKYFSNIYTHEAELDWLNGKFPLPVQAVRKMLADRCELPKDFDISHYDIFQGNPSRLLNDDDTIDLGGRMIQAFHTPGHSPGHLCFWEAEKDYLFSGDLVYRGTLFANYPSYASPYRLVLLSFFHRSQSLPRTVVCGLVMMVSQGNCSHAPQQAMPCSKTQSRV